MEKPEPFYRLPVSKQKTSSEIINEARSVLRTLRTQRPFTPAEDQRKLFGSGSSRAPQNRPPSVFSLHTSSFDLAESRPASGVRLSPLDYKPILVISSKDEDSSVSLPKPAVDAAEIRKISNARAQLFRRTSQGDAFPAKMAPLDHHEEKLDCEEPAMMSSLHGTNDNCLAEQRAYTPFNDKSRQLICNEHSGKPEREDVLKGTAGKLLFQLKGESNQMKKHGIVASKPRSIDWKTRLTGLEDGTRIDESEEEKSFWHLKVLPILQELESEDNVESLCLACTKLYQVLNEGNMLGKRCKRRSMLLKTLYKLVEIDSDPLCLKLAKIILSMKVDGKNLLGACKLAFKVCRNGKNDYLIQNDTLLDCLLEVLRTEDLQKNNEAILYCLGAIKFMSGNAVLLNEMVSKGAVEMLLQLMKQINNIKENDSHFSSLGHLLVQDLVIRIIFILGNLTAKNNQAREQFFKEEGSVNTLMSLFQTYHELDLNEEKRYHERGREEKKNPKHPSKAEDVLIKLIRVLANLSIHPSVGAALAAAHRVVELLVTVLEYKSIEVCEELVINAATTINNLSFYKVKSSAVQDKKLRIAEMLLKLLMSNNMDGVVEAVRVFGNLSQYHEICDFIVQKKIHKFVIALLDAKNQDVCFSACGVLLNLTVDKDRRALLMEEGGIGKLVDCLRDFGPADLQLACLICKTLWNYSENITSAALCFGEDTDTLLMLLTSLLDEELALGYSLDRGDHHKLYWETEFKPVAEKLLDRIQSHRSSVSTAIITAF
ncbi:armadillo repeat-containing protein 2 isoform X2 [Lagopus muta]|uniref:armadillo repeat-containing protein 2 isoform X2 n=1 Tax=Lagopus muta TaxID=64668 RepID=UPI00209C77FE|nr:armadillo repeat-containing protein 2 isoform X2 [Lagopus muta]